MEKNINFLGRLLRILMGMFMIYMAIKMATGENKKFDKPLICLIIAGFIGVVQGYHGFCILRKLGINTPV